MTLMILWRIWHIRNCITHDKPVPTIEGSCRFLESYVESLLIVKQQPQADQCKGKDVATYSLQAKLPGGTHSKLALCWKRPDVGFTKLNVDGSFVQADGSAGAGMILRNHEGNIVFAACRALFCCSDPLEAELEACEEGLRLALQWTNLPIILESDCQEAVGLIKGNDGGRSKYVHQVKEIRLLMSDERDVSLVKIMRDQNRASHHLACVGRSQQRTMCWLGNFPEDLAQVIANDCNTIT